MKELIEIGFVKNHNYLEYFGDFDLVRFDDNSKMNVLNKHIQVCSGDSDKMIDIYIDQYEQFKNVILKLCGDSDKIPQLFAEFQTLIETAEARLYEIGKLLEHETISFSCENLGYDISITSTINGVDIKMWLSLIGIIKVKRV